jgi:dephospho-CoA kinase
MLKIGLTGGIGSGKTLVCSIFEKLSVPVYYADIQAKHLINNDTELISALKELFGNDIYQANGAIHRKKLAEIIFNNNFALKKVNELVHPKVREDFNRWASQQNAPYVIQEAAILFESRQTHLFDKIITVTAPLEIRIERILNRDKFSREQVMERINNQIADEEKIRKSDFIINNSNDNFLLQQVLDIHNKLI